MLCSTNTSLVPHLAQGPIAQWDSLVSPSPHRPSKDSGSSQASPHFLFAFPLREAQALSPARSWALQAQQRWQHKSLCYGQLCPCQPRDDKMKGFYTCEILMDAQKNNYKLTVCGEKKNSYGSQYKMFKIPVIDSESWKHYALFPVLTCKVSSSSQHFI